MVTDLGKALDPAADKLIQIAMMLCAATRTKAAWLLLALHLVRELSLAALGARVLQCTGKVYSARWYGKLCTAVTYIVMAVLACYAGSADAGRDSPVRCAHRYVPAAVRGEISAPIKAEHTE